MVTREYALICHDRYTSPSAQVLFRDIILKPVLKLWEHPYRLVSIARGEKGYVEPSEISAATEDCKPSALTRCCKDLGIASELWDRRWVGSFKRKYCELIWVEDETTGKKSIIWMRKGISPEYPHKISSSVLPSDPQT